MIAAIYARKSTEQSGVADEQRSVARQIDHARQYAQRKGWTVDDDNVFVDDGVSGAEFANRAGFVRLMNTLKPRPPFQVLVMSEESRLGREAIETAYALKQFIQAGVRVFFYLEDRERTLETPTDKLLMSVAAFADELERDKARQRVTDAMVRKAKAGHNCGGRTFGYDNVDVPGPDGERAYVTYRVDDTEAAVVRRIFELAAMGEGLKAITHRLNAEGALSPRPQQGRTRTWAPSSVREILHREMYRGRRVWNKTRKRDSWGQRAQHDRPSADWLTIENEELRIISDALWLDVQARLAARRTAYDRWKRGDAGAAPTGQGVRSQYFLTGFGRCSCCGGTMQAVARKRSEHSTYCCSTYWNRGKSVCANGRTARMVAADRAVHDLLRDEVLRPDVIARALELAVDMLTSDTGGVDAKRRTLAKRLEDVDRELANLSETAARGGGVPAILAALGRRDQERNELTSEIAALARVNRPLDFRPEVLRRQLRARLDAWSALLTANVAEARPLLSLILAGNRIDFQPIVSGGYELTVPVAFDRVIGAAIPAFSRLQDQMASPEGFEPSLPA